MADISIAWSTYGADMEIRIELEATDPPRGRTFVTQAPQRFAGWLELIRALEDLLAGDRSYHGDGEDVRGLPASDGALKREGSQT